MKDEIDRLLNIILSAAFRQGMANQRNEDLQRELKESQMDIQEEATTVITGVQEFYKLLNINPDDKQELN